MNYPALLYYYHSLKTLNERPNFVVWSKTIQKTWNKTYRQAQEILLMMEKKEYIKRINKKTTFFKALNQEEMLLARLYQKTLGEVNSNEDKINAVHEFMNATKLDYTAVAKILDIDNSTISKWKKRANPDLNEIDKIKNQLIMAQSEVWDLRQAAAYKDQELIEARRARAIEGYRELDNARAQINKLLNLNCQLEEELRKLKVEPSST